MFRLFAGGGTANRTVAIKQLYVNTLYHHDIIRSDFRLRTCLGIAWDGKRLAVRFAAFIILLAINYNLAVILLYLQGNSSASCKEAELLLYYIQSYE